MVGASRRLALRLQIPSNPEGDPPGNPYEDTTVRRSFFLPRTEKLGVDGPCVTKAEAIEIGE